MDRHRSGGTRPFAIAVVVAFALAGCATTEGPPPPSYRPLTASEGRALVAKLLPDGVRDRAGWAIDIYAAVAALDVPQVPENFCAVIAIVGQESGFRADPAVPGLPAIAWKEIERQRERAGVPKLVLDAALGLTSPNGRSYRERIDAVRTEAELSAVFEDFIGMVPLATPFLARRNPVRTGGPMQVSIAFAEAHARAKPYPYAANANLRHEVFTRRGGLYFGTAHLLDYPAAYERIVYRFADFNAGHYASRNAAFQGAVTQLSGIPLMQDGDLLAYDGDTPRREPGNTELATRALGKRLGMTDAAIRQDLELAKTRDFERSVLWQRVFALADQAAGRRVSRAAIPQIDLKSPKITRPLTTDWFARRVQTRHDACLARLGS